MLKIEVNGEQTTIGARVLSDAIAELGYADMVCAVAVNGGFVPRQAHGETKLNENDQLDIVAPMKGG